MSAHTVFQFTPPPLALFKPRFEFPGLPVPETLPFPESYLQFGPVKIPFSLWKLSMEIRSPLLISASYLFLVIVLNKINKQRNKKPWEFTQSKIFRPVTILHNVILALYSAWAFYEAYKPLMVAWPQDKHDIHYTSRAVDALCEGSNFPPVTEASYLATPYTARARILFICWTFYISKFYEILDTAIILACGRTVSTLHMFHHAGVICIGWMVLYTNFTPALVGLYFNAAVHTVMYSYYTLTALRVRVPVPFKAALTSLQISQFVFGLLITSSYLFIQFEVPVDSSGLKQKHGNLSSNLLADRSSKMQTVRCMNDSNEAVLLVVMNSFVTLLMVMFLRFFWRTYLSGRNSGGNAKQKAH